MCQLKKFFIKFLVFFGTVGALGAIATGLALYSFSSLPTSAPMPNPNGYDAFVHAGTAISTAFRNYKTMNQNQLRDALKVNATAVAQGHDALKLECQVPLQWPPAPENGDENAAPLNLAEAFTAEGLLAEAENRTKDAIKYYLDVVRLGNQSCRGGLIGDGLRGLAIESSGTDHLQKLSVILDPKACAGIVKDLESIDSKTESVSSYFRQEKIWYHQNSPTPKDSLNWYYKNLLSINANLKTRTDSRHTFSKLESGIRQDIVGIAVRAYEGDKGVRPTQVADLVPAYLTAVLTDPLTGTNIDLHP